MAFEQEAAYDPAQELESCTVSCVVTEDMLEKKLGCGDTETYAIGMMVSLMEQAAKQLAEKYLPEGMTTIGVMMNATHVAPTVLGNEVRATATLLERGDGQFYFEIIASDNMGTIGEATHHRVAVSLDQFNEKAKKRGRLS